MHSLRPCLSVFAIVFIFLVNSILIGKSLAHPPGVSLDIPCSVTFSGGINKDDYGHLSFLLSAPISGKLRKAHNLDSTTEGENKWSVTVKVPLTSGGVATFVAGIKYFIKEKEVFHTESAATIPLITIERLDKENSPKFKRKMEKMKKNFGLFPTAKCTVSR